MGGISRPPDLLVVVPGIGGSVLRRGDETIWEVSFERIAQRLLDPGTLAWSSADDGVCAVGFVKSANLPGLTVIHGYDRLVNGLQRMFPDARVDSGGAACADRAADVVLCPYDFRQSVVVSADALEARLGSLLDGSPERRMVVIAHSMGGLVARRWLASSPKRWRRCRALLTLGTPFHGSPKALDLLVNGIRLGPVMLGAATNVIRTWPALYELLPRGMSVLDGASGEPFRLGERPLSFLDARRAAAAFALHDETDDAWYAIDGHREAPEAVPFVGFGHGTPERAVWRDGALRLSRERAEWLGQPEWNGDGTVPAYSAAPAELFAKPARWLPLPARHGALASIAEVFTHVRTIEELGSAPVRGDDDGRPTLGIDLDEWYPACDSIRLFARLSGTDLAARGPRVFVEIEGSGQQCTVELERDGSGWSGELGPLGAGAYGLKASATGAGDRDPRPIEELFAVVEQ